MSYASKNRNKRKPRYQLLEDRRLLAGDVTVVENGHLYIRGDGADNQFEIVVEDSQLVINGLEGTRINGQESVTVVGAEVTDSGVSFAGGLRAHLGPGHDDFAVRDAQFESMSVIFGGTGDDNIDVVDSSFMDRFTIQTFDGDDTVSATRSHFEDSFFAITLDGQDAVSIVDSVTVGDSVVVTGNHSDSIHSQGNHYMGEVNLILPLDGNDTVVLNDPVVGEHQLGVFLGGGDDSFGADLVNADVTGSIRVSGQAGNDVALEMSMNDEVAAQTTILSLEKGELVFESGLGGLENVTEGISSYVTQRSNILGQARGTYATPVVLETTEAISQIEWSGTYTRDYSIIGGLPDFGDSFFIEIYEDAGDGAPDADSVVIFEVGEATRAVAGVIDVGYYGETSLYSYHAEIDYTMEAGKQYWVSIYTELDQEEDEQSNHWEWGLGLSRSNPETAYNTADNDWRRFVRFQEGAGNPYLLGVQMDLRLRS